MHRGGLHTSRRFQQSQIPHSLLLSQKYFLSFSCLSHPTPYPVLCVSNRLNAFGLLLKMLAALSIPPPPRREMSIVASPSTGLLRLSTGCSAHGLPLIEQLHVLLSDSVFSSLLGSEKIRDRTYQPAHSVSQLPLRVWWSSRAFLHCCLQTAKSSATCSAFLLLSSGRSCCMESSTIAPLRTEASVLRKTRWPLSEQNPADSSVSISATRGKNMLLEWTVTNKYHNSECWARDLLDGDMTRQQDFTLLSRSLSTELPRRWHVTVRCALRD